jgi:HK97 family phage prohead protease
MQATEERRRLEPGAKLEAGYRNLQLKRADPAAAGARSVPGLDYDKRTLTFTFSSEEPVARWFGSEVLSHKAGAADFSRLNDSANVLFNHDMDDVLGVVERAWIDEQGRGNATIRFGKDERGQWALDQVADEIFRNVSFMYDVAKYRIESDEEDPYYDPDAVYTATEWLAYEISIVSVPADQSVGVGRAFKVEPRNVQVEVPTRSVSPAAPAVHQPNGDSMIPQRKHVLREQETERGAGGGSAAVATREGAQPGAGAAPDVVAQERQRVTEITALCRKHNIPFEATNDMIQRGVTIAEARGIVLERISAGGQKPVASMRHDNVDLTEKEKRNYSILRAISAMVGNDWTKAGFEREVSQEISKRMGKETNGFFMPTNLPFAPDEAHLRAWNAWVARSCRRARRTPWAARPPAATWWPPTCSRTTSSRSCAMHR